MAVVPTAKATENLRPINPGYQTSRATADDFGARRGKSLEKAGASLMAAGDKLGDVVLREQQEDNERGAKELEIQYRNRVNNILYGDGTKENLGYLNQQGENAVSNQVAAQEAIKKARQELLESSDNSRVKEMFGISSAVLEGAYSSSMSQHASQQRIVANDAASEARKMSAVDAAAQGGGDPEILATSLAIARNETLDTAERKGWQQDQTIAEVKKAQSAVYSAAITTVLQDNPDEAIKMYNTYKAGMDAQTAAVLGRQVQEVATISLAQKIVDEEFAKGGSSADINKRIRDRTSGKIEEEAIQEANGRISELRADFSFQESLKNAAWREEQRALALKDAADKKFLEDTQKMFTQQVRTGTSVNDAMAGLTPDQARVINEQPYFLSNMERIEKANINGQMFAKVTDGHTLKDIKSMADDKRAGYDLETNRPLMTEDEYKQAVNLVTSSYQKVKDLQEGKTKTYDVGQKYLRLYAPNDLDWGLTKQGKADEAVQKAVSDEMDSFISSYTAQGKEPTEQEIKEKAKELLLPVYQRNKFFKDNLIGVEGSVAKMTPQQRAVAYIPIADVPEDLKALVTKTIKDRGLKVTDRLIEDLAFATITQDAKRAKALLGGQ